MTNDVAFSLRNTDGTFYGIVWLTQSEINLTLLKIKYNRRGEYKLINDRKFIYRMIKVF